VQAVLLEVLEQGAIGSLQDKFRRSGGAGRKQHEQRVIEREALEPVWRGRGHQP
jgi:hypothetical protein